MTPPATTPELNDPAAGCADALRCLADVTATIREIAPWVHEFSTTDPERIATVLDQITAEHRGMADELLNVYEQLGIVFEVTRRLPTVSGEDDVLDLFLASLQRSFAGREVFAAVARCSNQANWSRIRRNGLIFEHEPLNEPISFALYTVCSGPGARTRVVEIAESQPSDASDRATTQALIAPVYSGNILVCSLVILRRATTDAGSAPEFRASDMSLVESLATFCGDLIRNHRLVREMREMSIAMVRALVSAVDQKDQYTCGHSLRVGYFATTLGRLLKLPEPDLQMLQWSALLHDVGKIGIRDEVLNKKGKLTPEEFRHIQEHPERSHQVVQQIPQLRGALDGVLHHHERWDGSGYPAGLKGQEIPLQARIIQIADVFDALTSSRSYRPAYDWKQALDLLAADAGTIVDPQLQAVFDQHLRPALENDPLAWDQMIQKANQFAAALGGNEGAGLVKSKTGKGATS